MASGSRQGGNDAGDGVMAFRASAPEVSIGRLPRTGRDLFGRTADLAWLDRCWTESVNVATIVAFGGVGKSTLVNAWLQGMARAGWRGAARVYGWSFYSQGTTDRMTSADEFISAALRWFGDPDPTAGSPWDKGERLAGLVGSARSILVLDGLEPLQWGPGPKEGEIKDAALQALVRGLGAQNAGMCVISSRIGVLDLEDYGESCRQLDLEHLSDEAGAVLLNARGVKGAEEELREAAREVRGHCLTLALLGSYLEEACEGDVRRRHEIGPLEEDERLGGHARRVMEAYARWFHGGPEIAILRMLGLFDRPATEGEIEALRKGPQILGLTEVLARLKEHQWNRAVARLRRVGLLAVESSIGEDMDTHPLVRQHFGEQLRQEQPEAWREGHRRLYVYLRDRAKPFPETIEEMAPLYTSIMHGCRAGMYKDALQEIYMIRIQRGPQAFAVKTLGAYGNQVAVMSSFFDPPWEHLAQALPDRYAGFILHEAGRALQALGRLTEAARLFDMVVHRGISRMDWEEAAAASGNLCEVLLTIGNLAEALISGRRCVELADRSGEKFVRMTRRTRLAAVLHALGRPTEAVACFEESERIQAEMEPRYPILYSLRGFQYCELLLDLGRVAEAARRAAWTIRLGRVLRVPLDIAFGRISAVRVRLGEARFGVSGKLESARRHSSRAVEDIRRSGRYDYMPVGLLARAEVHLLANDLTHARTDLERQTG